MIEKQRVVVCAIWLLVLVSFSTAWGQNFTVSVTKQGDGTGDLIANDLSGRNLFACGSVCSISVAANTTIILGAHAGSGSGFAGWTGGTGSAAVCNGAATSPCNFTVTANSTVIATFTKAFTVGVTKQGDGNGLVIGKRSDGSGMLSCPTSCSGIILEGQQLTLNASAASGSFFAGWSSPTGSATCTGTVTQCLFTINRNSTVVATFNLTKGPFSLNVTQQGNGKGQVLARRSNGTSVFTCPAICSASVSTGTQLILAPTAASGSFFAGWSNGTGSASGCNGLKTNCTFTISQNSTVIATFQAVPVP